MLTTKALRIVLDLATQNALDASNCDKSQLEQADQQAEAIDEVEALHSKMLSVDEELKIGDRVEITDESLSGKQLFQKGDHGVIVENDSRTFDYNVRVDRTGKEAYFFAGELIRERK